jgi:hypothetical protein
VPELPINEPVEIGLEEPPGSLEALERASSPDEVVQVAAAHPSCLGAWARLGDLALDRGEPVAAYAYYRVGYHRGLDRLRASGWRGAGHVPWSHPSNRGFLGALRGLGRAAAAIGEDDEARRCADFLGQVAPDAPR